MNKYVGLLASAGALCLPFAVSAAGPSLSDILVNSGISAAGYVDGSYEATFNKTGGVTGAGSIPLHQFDNNANSFLFNQAAISLGYQPSDGFGAFVNVIAGEDGKVINAAYGSGASDFALTQAYVQYAHGPWTVIGGRFVTLAGAEVIDDTKNTNVSRSLLFTNLEPLVHTGVRVAYKASDLLTGYVGLVNSAINGGADFDKHKTAEIGAAITPNSAIAINLVDYYGSDGTGPAQAKNNYLDLVASWQATTALQFVINGDYVRAIGTTDTVPTYLLGLIPGNTAAAPIAGTSSSEGLAFYVNDQFSDSWKGSLRAEYAYIKGDANLGAGSAGVHLAEVTATVDYSATKNVDLLGEVRDDYGSIAGGSAAGGFHGGVFPNGSEPLRKSQPEILLKAIYKFGTPTPST